jgi:hypothetical protein
MKSNLLKYALIAGALLIWGIVVFRVIDSLKDNNMPTAEPARLPSFDYTTQKDTFSLYADYPDPFLPEADVEDSAMVQSVGVQSSAAPAPSAGNNQVAVTPPVDQFSPASVKYTGMINNPEKKIKMALLKINGQEITLREKAKSNDIMLLSIQPDKIVIKRKNKRYEIQREQ